MYWLNFGLGSRAGTCTGLEATGWSSTAEGDIASKITDEEGMTAVSGWTLVVVLALIVHWRVHNSPLSDQIMEGSVRVSGGPSEQ